MTSTATFAPAVLAPTRDPAHAAPILVAVTGNDDGDVLRAAQLLARHRSVALQVLAVVEPLPLYFTGTDAIVVTPPDDTQARRVALLDQAHVEVWDALGSDTNACVAVRYGDPAEEITSAARAAGASLIIVGIGRHGARDRLLGSETALRVVRLADRPVLAVAGRMEALPGRILVGTDFSASSARAAEHAVPLIDPSAVITFAHVWRRSGITSSAIAATEATYARSLPTAVERLARAVDPHDTHARRTVVVEGSSAERLLALAAGNGADLVVVGRQTHAWFDRLFVGSVAAAVLRGSTCAVLVTPDPGMVEKDRLRRLVDGMSEGRHPAEWSAQLDGFSRRNAGRRVSVEEDDPALGARTLVAGLPLLGVAYDPHDRRVSLMIGEPALNGPRITHGIGDVRSIAVLTADDRTDTALCIRHAGGQVVLTLAPPGPRAR